MTRTSLVAPKEFLQAARDSGYRDLAFAISELIDNSIQAHAKEVRIEIEQEDKTFNIQVVDDGKGMTRDELKQCLRFGGSSRFNDRRGLGRFGMGLPNSSISQCRRVDVFSWQNGQTFRCSLDLQTAKILGPIKTTELDCRPETGTAVRWIDCDRIQAKRIGTIEGHLIQKLGQIYRHLLAVGFIIRVNSIGVQPIDPLGIAGDIGAKPYGEVLKLAIHCESGKMGEVTVRFSVLPVAKLSKLDVKQKRDMGIVKGAGVSVVREGREIDFGWFFMGGKRKENYDDWWRCEVQFAPALDEEFGVTNNKQHIRPSLKLREILDPVVGSIARELNAVVRRKHLELSSNRPTALKSMLDKSEQLLPPSLPTERISHNPPSITASSTEKYPVIVSKVQSRNFIEVENTEGRLICYINSDHPFYKSVYKQIAELSDDAKSALDLVFISYAKAELSFSHQEVSSNRKLRSAWGDVLSTMLNFDDG